MIGEGVMLRRPWMKAVAGEPAAPTVGFTADPGDVGGLETARSGFFPGNVIECIDSRAQVAGRAERGRARQRREVRDGDGQDSLRRQSEFLDGVVDLSQPRAIGRFV